jgi:hypothetical protein
MPDLDLDEPFDEIEREIRRTTQPPRPSYRMLADSCVPPPDDPVDLDKTVPSLTLTLRELDQLDLPVLAQKVIVAIDGVRSVEEIAARVGLSIEEVDTQLRSLVRRGLALLA